MTDRTDVLIVDEEYDQVRLFSEILEILGYATIGFSNSLKANEYLDYHHSEIHLLLIDLRMPFMTGFQIIKIISKIDKHIKILVLSA